jgi:uncharacterized membrane protein
MPSTKLSLSKRVTPEALDLSIPPADRALASAAYLAAFGGFWLVVPAALYFWKGRESKFLGFHAVQAVMLHVAMIPIAAVAAGVGMALGVLLEGIGGRAATALLVVLVFLILGLALMLPAAATLWMGLSALRGQPRSLPLLGRWARRVVGDDV